MAPPQKGELVSRLCRPGAEDWHNRARFVLRHLGDPFALQESALSRLPAVDRLAKTRYEHSILPAGRAIRELSMECLGEIEEELGDNPGVARLKSFVEFTRRGMRVAEASKRLGITPEYASRALKRRLVGLLAEKLEARLH